MDNPIEVIQYKGKEIKIYTDDMPQDPREWDNLGKMVCFHNRYQFPNELNIRSEDYQDWKEMEADIIYKNKITLHKPLYLYDHSGLRLKAGSFQGLLPQGHAEFDSGQIGFIFAFDDDVRKWYGVKKITNTIIKKVERHIQSEIEDYDSYISGSVYAYSVEGIDEIDFCGGFYEVNEAIISAKEEIDLYIKQEDQKRERRTKGYIRNQIPVMYRK